MSWGSCPHCGSQDVRGSGGDLGNGDEYQDRACFTCGASSYWLRSEGSRDGNWSDERPFKIGPARVLASDFESALLEQVADEPDDDGPRSVYADHLIARGDPLGAFIAAQLQRARYDRTKPTRDEQTLLERHWTAWLGPAVRVVARYRLEWVRGFWTSCDAFDASAAASLDEHARCAALTCHSWSTVRRLVVRRAFPHLEELLRGPIRRSLRVLHVEGKQAIEQVAALAPTLAIEELRYRDDHWDKLATAEGGMSGWFSSVPFPSLRRVTIYGGEPHEVAIGERTITVVPNVHSNEPTLFDPHPHGLRLKRR